ncbi:hypothetical protein ABB37_06077 [Leptomonas pyrrhocoris]|uniref:Uncharacterized protein n=1 Tax=Leptomonas pyrrhocoris TaxID=157538 RepID=A0A0M9FY13_LEPPY|nr:hypothetical protein ABB37_06077 [Leptomonas pyrrhocoris]KPA78450.1 hypothetical protein ABB37_06077 [Leptomonas pyrrhocoris]|eukprot:XP_015656889.1 hypothetical protein ABB37_06077 [Leptomonas pyrrhocoris]
MSQARRVRGQILCRRRRPIHKGLTNQALVRQWGDVAPLKQTNQKTRITKLFSVPTFCSPYSFYRESHSSLYRCWFHVCFFSFLLIAAGQRAGFYGP